MKIIPFGSIIQLHLQVTELYSIISSIRRTDFLYTFKITAILHYMTYFLE